MTELIWDGKYDKATGKKVAPLKTALPPEPPMTLTAPLMRLSVS